ncbi:MAG: DUF4330 domain-containing protein [Defluviitaleaceae bacterium]|nr:DUF4330 domain-containing protein [Defluviitaleaceae bacterium]MCL2837338.1 DUF4330 domain-containing protein [Defluviitaleaceae bacterium]
MDKPEKLRFSMLDALIAAGVLAAALLAVWFFYFRGSGGEDVWVEYTFEARGMPLSYEGVPIVGGRVYDSVRGDFLGVVVDAYYRPAKLFTEDVVNQRFREEAVPDQLDVFIVIRAEAVETADNIRIAGDSFEIRVGTHMFVKGKGYAAEGYCVALSTSPRGD